MNPSIPAGVLEVRNLAAALLFHMVAPTAAAFDDPAELAVLVPSQAGLEFGSTCAISGDTIVVGAPTDASGIAGDESDTSAPGSGAAFVFVRDGAGWVQQAYLKAFNIGANDRFGHSVSISGDTIVVGARDEDGSASGVGGADNNGAADSGAAYVFTRSGGVWSQEAYLKASNTDAYDWFGISVGVSGDTVLVGARYESSNARTINGEQGNNLAGTTGAAYVFTRSGGVWTQQAYLKAANAVINDQFGSSVAIDGDTAVVGAGAESNSATGVNGEPDHGSALFSGAAYVFVRAGVGWSQQAYLKASNTDALDLFGEAVAVHGDTIVVGARGEASLADGVDGNQADNNGINCGAAYVFFRIAGVWVQQAYLKASDSDFGFRFGGAVAVHGDRVAVGSASRVFGGGLYLFEREAGVWAEDFVATAVAPEGSGAFGAAAGLSEDLMIGGALGGSVRVIGEFVDVKPPSGSGPRVISVESVTNAAIPGVEMVNLRGEAEPGVILDVLRSHPLEGDWHWVGQVQALPDGSFDFSDFAPFPDRGFYIFSEIPEP